MTTSSADHVYARREQGDQSLTVHQDGDVAPVAVLVYLHGGGWRGGDRAVPNLRTRLLPLTAHGVIVISADYRLVPAARYPAQLEDAGDAFEWAAERYPDLPIFLAGASAGAHLVSLVGLGAWELLTGRRHRAKPAGIVPYAAVNDPWEYDEERRRTPRPLPGTFAHAALQRGGPWPPIALGALLVEGGDTFVSPVVTNHIAAEPTAPPFLIVVGDDDTCVRPKHSVDIFETLSSRGNEAYLLEIAGGDHEDAAFDSPIVRGALLGFIERFVSQDRVPVGFPGF